MSEEKRTKSGEHPAVKEYRRKLDSIAEDTAPSDLDQKLAKYLDSVKPPPPEEDPTHRT